MTAQRPVFIPRLVSHAIEQFWNAIFDNPAYKRRCLRDVLEVTRQR